MVYQDLWKCLLKKERYKSVQQDSILCGQAKVAQWPVQVLYDEVCPAGLCGQDNWQATKQNKIVLAGKLDTEDGRIHPNQQKNKFLCFYHCLFL